MTIDAATATTVSVNSSTAMSKINSKSVDNSNINSDTSFEQEMSKAGENNAQENVNLEKSKEDKVAKVSDKKDTKEVNKNVQSKKAENEHKAEKSSKENIENKDNNQSKDEVLDSIAQFSLIDANDMLTNNIQEMINSNSFVSDGIFSLSANKTWGLFLGNDRNSISTLSMNEQDAAFFINLAQNNDTSNAAISAQSQEMINAGFNIEQVAKSSQVSKALLNALRESRENNQPIRIDFDKDISVVLRVGRDGAIAAHFIPGDKAVEQYLKNNIEALKNTFDEQDLPYSDLSYSNSSKKQNQKRRNEQQGE